jgi:hypothetical protein
MRGLIDDPYGPFLVLGSWPISSGGLCLQYLRKWPGFPHHYHTNEARSLVSRGLCLHFLWKRPGFLHRQHNGFPFGGARVVYVASQ